MSEMMEKATQPLSAWGSSSVNQGFSICWATVKIKCKTECKAVVECWIAWQKIVTE